MHITPETMKHSTFVLTILVILGMTLMVRSETLTEFTTHTILWSTTQTTSSETSEALTHSTSTSSGPETDTTSKSTSKTLGSTGNLGTSVISTSPAGVPTETTGVSGPVSPPQGSTSKAPCSNGKCSDNAKADTNTSEENGAEIVSSTSSPKLSSGTKEPSTVSNEKYSEVNPMSSAEETSSAEEPITSGAVGTDYPTDEFGHRIHHKSMSDEHVSIFSVVFGIIGAILIILIAMVIHRLVRNPGKKMFLNWEAKRLDVLALRRFTVNDVRSSFGGIPTSGDIWHDMKQESNVVV